MSDNQQVPQFDPANFSIESYVKRIEKPWGYELHWVREDAPYMGKIIHVNEGGSLSLQVHDQKEESYLMMSGRAKLIWENNKGQMVETEMQPGMGYATRVGQKHRIVAITDCDVVEASTPEKGTTFAFALPPGRPRGRFHTG